MSADSGLRLLGRTIVLTRPLGQNGALADAIVADGGNAIEFPVLEVRPIDDPTPVLQAADELDQCALAIFISPNAVEHALDLILAHRAWPERLQTATVGPASAAALRARGVRHVLAPEGRYDSEALLAVLPEDWHGRRVFVFRGQAGRELLGETLAQRGAEVRHVACYRRACPDVDAKPLIERWRDGTIHAAVLASSEGVRNFHRLLGADAQPLFDRLPVFVPHARIADAARSLGARHVIQTMPGDAGLLSEIRAFWAKVPAAHPNEPPQK